MIDGCDICIVVANETVSGIFLAMNNTTQHSGPFISNTIPPTRNRSYGRSQRSLTASRRLSTLDLFGSAFVSTGRPLALSTATARSYRAGIDFRFIDGDVDWRFLTKRDDADAVLIRPDGFVTA